MKPSKKLLAATKNALDIIQWMSGSPSFSPEGEASIGWAKAQPRIQAIRDAIADAEAEVHGD